MKNPRDVIQVFQPALGAEEADAVRAVFDSSWVGRGAITEAFEAEFAQAQGVDAALMRSVSCCTEGLFQSMALVGVEPGDEVVLPTISFVGAGNAVAASGARPVFCDVDPRTLNATAETIEACLTPRTRAVLLLHYGGVPCRLDEIVPLLRERGVALIEDSACSVASRLQGRACGTWGDIGVWSFDAMKILVTGDGGMLYTSTPERAANAARQLYLGLQESSGFSSARESRWWEFTIDGFGRRAIMNDVTAAIGRVQLGKLPGFLARRRHVHETYTRELRDVGWLATPPDIPSDAESSYYFYWIQTSPERRDRLAVFLRERGIYSTFRYHPLHRVPAYGSTTQLPHAEGAAAATLCLPLHQALGDDDVGRVIDAVRTFGDSL